MPIAADRSGAAVPQRAVTLRIKRGAKVLSEVKIGRSRVVVGGGQQAQLRLKNAGLADECVVLDTRSEPFGIESRLGPEDVRVNGRPMLSSLVRFGDVIEFSGLALELVEGEPAARRATSAPAPAPKPSAPATTNGGASTIDERAGGERGVWSSPGGRTADQERIDPYMGKQTAAAVKQAEIERARQLLERQRSNGNGNGNGAGTVTGTGSAPGVPARPVAVPPGAVSARGAARAPWIELVGDDSIADARLHLRDGATAGRQGDLRIRHPSVSKKHARFTFENGRVFVEDLGSTNGVWINRERIASRRPLSDGDTLHLGAVEFAVRIPGAAANQGEVTTLGESPDAAPPPATRLGDRPTDLRERRTEQDGVVPRAREREQRTEHDGQPADLRRPTEREQPAPVFETEVSRSGRGADGAAPAGNRPTDPERESPMRSPFRDDDVAPTGTGRPGRRDATARDLTGAKPRSPTPSQLFDDVEDISEKYSIDPPMIAERAPARTTVRPPEPATRSRDFEAAFDDEFVPRRRRSVGKMMFVAFVGMALAAGIVSVVVVWPGIAEQLAQRFPAAEGLVSEGGAGDSTASDPGRGVKARNASGGRKTARRPDTSPGSGVASDGEGLPPEGSENELTVDGEAGAPFSIFGGEAPVDLRGGEQLDRELAHLEKGSAEKGLRAERTIGTSELESIFLSDERAIVRKLYQDDGFEHAPSAADDDPRDAEARRQGAKQIDTNRVNALIRGKFPAVKNCLVGASVKRGTARVVVEFTIQPNGRPDNVSVIDSDIGGSAFKSCVTGVVRGIRFPKPKDQSVVVQFPFVFTYN